MEHHGWALGLQCHLQVWFLSLFPLCQLCYQVDPILKGSQRWCEQKSVNAGVNAAEESECLTPLGWRKS